MRFFITSDSYLEAKVDKVVFALSDTGYKGYFSEQDYGSSLEGVMVVLMCRHPDLKFKQRLRFVKKEKILYLDIMLDLEHFLNIDQKEKERIIVGKLISEIPLIIAKYKLADFNLGKFKLHLKKWVSKIL